MAESNLDYKYINDKTPLEKIDYSYSEFRGEEFIDAWKTSRKSILNGKEVLNVTFSASKERNSRGMFTNWIVDFQKGCFNDFQNINLLLKRFEVTRKIYESYDKNFRPFEKSTDFSQIELYILFSYVLVNAYKETKKLYYLNSILKLNDIMISNEMNIKENDQNLFHLCLENELIFIEELRNKLI